MKNNYGGYTNVGNACQYVSVASESMFTLTVSSIDPAHLKTRSIDKYTGLVTKSRRLIQGR